MNLYLTSQDWVQFSGSKQIEKIERVKSGIFSYLLVTTVEPIRNSKDNTESRQLLLTSTFHFIGSNYMTRLPLELNVFSVKQENGKMRYGDCLAKGVDLHTKEQ